LCTIILHVYTNPTHSYNHATKDEQYTSTLDLIKEFVGAISKGGNFLLSIGPDGSGQIPKIQADRLLEMGKWIRRVRPSIFESEPYWVTSSDSHEPGQPLFFTQSQGSFYIFSMERPKAQRVVIKTSVPLHSTSTIRMMGTDDLLEWKVFSNGRLIIDVPNEVLDQENLVWVFEISAPLS
jgi:alpha-L-fucosidase